MALRTLRPDMRSGEREIRIVMNECGRLPRRSRVTALAIMGHEIRRVIGVVRFSVIGFMARPTIGWCTGELPAHVTVRAARLNVRSG